MNLLTSSLFKVGTLLVTVAGLAFHLRKNSPGHNAQLRKPIAQGNSRTAELERLTRHLMDAREEEKARLARELHDELGSSLTAVNMDLAWVRQRLQDPALSERLNRAMAVLTTTIRAKRRIINDLRPPTLDNLGLIAAVESYTADWAASSGITIETDLPDELPELKPGCLIAIFRILQEALTLGSLRIASAAIKVKLYCEQQMFVLEVSTDGGGAGSAAASPQDRDRILEMQERAKQAGGLLTLTRSSERSGSIVQAKLRCIATPAPSGE